MTTLDELKDYLSIQNPIGALMVTGKWGSGKTYLVEHDLKDAVKDSCIILKVSLFGITETESVHHAVKESWVDAWLSEIDAKHIADTGNKIKNYLKNIPLPESVKSVVNIDPIEFVEIKNMIGDKKAVLVFDDLERCRLNIVDILGCINSYCENQHFHTIIIANEERIHDTKAGEVSTNDFSEDNAQLLYKEIKEKIVLRTLYYKPDYKVIIENIIKEFLLVYNNSEKDCDKEYAKVISNNSKRIASLFVNAENVFMNNIRCIKCALQDFTRVHHLLYENAINDIENWLELFFLFEAAVRNGFIHSMEGKQAIREFQELVNNYFNDMYFIHGVAEWITRGVWNSEEIEKDIYHIREIQSLDNDCDRLRLGSVLDLDEIAFFNGWGELVRRAYQGDLSLDDYLNFLRNIVILRMAGEEIGESVYRGIRAGLGISIKRVIRGESKDNRKIECSEVFKVSSHLTEYERYFLEAIDTFRTNKIQEKVEIEKKYLDAISKGMPYFIKEYKGKSLNLLTENMVLDTCDAFFLCSNSEKNEFLKVFSQMYKDAKLYYDDYLTNRVLEKIMHYEDECRTWGKIISLYHAGEWKKAITSLKTQIKRIEEDEESLQRSIERINSYLLSD